MGPGHQGNRACLPLGETHPEVAGKVQKEAREWQMFLKSTQMSHHEQGQVRRDTHQVK